MNFQFYIEKLENSEEFKKFKQENTKAHLCSGFFVRDKEGGSDDVHIDFYNPEDNKIMSFQLHDEVKGVPIDKKDEFSLEELDMKMDFDFNEIEKMIDEKMVDNNVKNKIQKILLSLQRVKGVNYLIGTIFITGLGMIKIKIDLDKKEFLEFEKKSFLDMMKIIKKD